MLAEQTLVRLTTIIIAGTFCHLLAWHLHLPSIILLLVMGFFLGPITGFIDPDLLFGDLLLPLVAMSVAIILFEGGLTLNVRELKNIGGSLRKLVSVGALVTWVLATLGAQYFLNMPGDLALLFGAIMVVTGPTVVGPLLRFIRPTGNVGQILNWEGIVIDPIGATLAVLVLEVTLLDEGTPAAGAVLLGITKTIFLGSLVAFVAGWILIKMVKRFVIPDFLHNPIVLAFVLGAYALANHFQTESGLLAVTILGILLANQQEIVIRHIHEFKVTLRVLLISALFITLTSRVEVASVAAFGWGGLAFLVFLIGVVRPISVVISSIQTTQTWRETVFIAFMAPRGVVAASVASMFALRLAVAGREEAQVLVPAAFLVIIGTVIFYSLVSRPLALLLEVSRSEPTGFMIVGAHHLARELGKAIQRLGFEVAVIDSNLTNVELAIKDGLCARHANVLSDEVFELVDSRNLGYFLALTSNDEVNALAVKEYVHLFGSSRVFQVQPSLSASSPDAKRFLQGRPLFGEEVTYDYLVEHLALGGFIDIATIEPTSGHPSFRTESGEPALPLFLLPQENLLEPITQALTEIPATNRAVCLIHPEVTKYDLL